MMNDAQIADAARYYVGARLATEGADGPNLREAALDVDRAWHELAFMVLGSCHYCEDGTCPFLDAPIPYRRTTVNTRPL